MNLQDILGQLVESLRENGIQPPVIEAVIKDLRQAAEEEKAEKGPKAPRTKPQVVVLAIDPEARLRALGDIGALVLTLEADADPLSAIERAKEAGLSFNRTAAGMKNPVRSLAEVFEAVKGRHWKDDAHPERKTKPLTRELVTLIPVTGRLD
jgi:hypothetical protein